MFGKPEWFRRRKYGGWGLTPNTWQGWVYIAVMVAPIVALQKLGLEENLMFQLTAVWSAVFIIDLIDLMMHLKKDEREKQIEAVSERNSAWSMVAVITLGLVYQVSSSTVKGVFSVDPFLLAALLMGAVVKSVTNIYLERRM